MAVKNNISHIDPVSRSLDVCSVDGNTIPQCIMGTDNCYEGTWKVISYSMNIDFIHDIIHDTFCRKPLFLMINKKVANDRRCMEPGHGGRLNIKMSSSQYREFHIKDKTVSRPSYL